jgi:propanol-preferring alcohol dehydrogenase
MACTDGSDQFCGDWRGITPAPGVDCTGHEGAGHVAAVGPGVTRFKVGDRVGITPVYRTCNDQDGKEVCEMCQRGHETICYNKEYVAMNHNGTYTQYPLISEQWAIKIPEGIPFEQAAPFMCSGGTAYTAVLAAGLKAGEWVTVFGAGGGVGHMVVQFCHANGYKVIGVDVGDDKAKVVSDAGGDHFVDAVKAGANVADEVKKLTPGGAGTHAVIITAGNGKAYAAAPYVLRPLGVQVTVGIPAAGEAIAGADPAWIVFMGITIRGILVTSRKDMEDALVYLKDGKVKEHVTVYPFKYFPKALANVAASKTNGRQVIEFMRD